MRRPDRQASLWLQDLLTPRAVEYVMLLQPQSIAFVRLTGARVEPVVAVAAGDLAAAQQFLRDLPHRPQYYGQPFSVLIHGDFCYSYLHLLQPGKGGELTQKARFFQNERIRFVQEVRQVGNRHLFIGQGIESDYLGALQETMAEANLPVVSISTLGAQLGRTLPITTKPHFHQIEVPPDQQYYMAFDGRTGVAFGKSEHGEFDSNDKVNSLRTGLFGPDVKVATTAWTGRPDKGNRSLPTHSLGVLLPHQARHDNVAHKPARRASWTQRTLNVSRLLALALGSLAIVGILLALALKVFTPSNEAGIEKYQREYSRQLQLAATVDSLMQTIARQRGKLPAHQVSSPWVAVFCQERLPHLYLNRLTIVHEEDGALRLGAIGAAQRESQVFRYVELLEQQSDDPSWELQTMAPEVIFAAGKPDTVQSFTLRLTRGGHGR